MVALCYFLLRILEIDKEGILNYELALISPWAKVWSLDFSPAKTEA